MDAFLLLASALSYALKAVALVVPDDLSLPTPCAEWDLNLLLRHLCDSIGALDEALITGVVTPVAAVTADGPDPVETVRDRAAALLCHMFASPRRVVAVAGLPVPSELIVATGAAEVSVHGWDVYAACGRGRVVPASLARPLIRLFPQIVPAREGLFAGPFAVPPCASPGDQLVAYLGRDPSTRHSRPILPAMVTGE